MNNPKRAGIIAGIMVAIIGLIQAVLISQRSSQPEAPAAAMPKFSEIVYTRPDLEALTRDFESLIRDLEADAISVEEGVSRLQSCYDAYDNFYTMDTVAELRYYHDVTDSFYADESD